MSKNEEVAGGSATRAEIDSLNGREPDNQIADRLREIAADFGTVLSVAPVQHPKLNDAEHDRFFIQFDKTADAIAASRAFKGLLYGFTTLVVSLPRSRRCELPRSPG